MKEIIVTEKLRCDMCGTQGTELEPVTEAVSYTWDGQAREIDLCVVDLKEVRNMFDALGEKSRRADKGKRTIRRNPDKRQPYSGETRFNEWYNSETELFECPFTATGTDGETHKCQRQFTTANGLAVHHNRQHGSNL